MSILSLQLFGPMTVQVNDTPLPRLKTRKGLWLLALLALRAGREVERDWLAGTLWPEAEAENSLLYLRQTLTDLRHALGTEAERLQSPSPRTLCFDLTGAEIDLLSFEKAIAQGDAASLEQAITVYRGPLLEGCAEAWVVTEREAREQAYLGALEKLAMGAFAEGSASAAVCHLRLLVTADPLRESAHRALMEALAASRDYAAVTETYRELRLLLRRELNAEPDTETQALFHHLRAQARQQTDTRHRHTTAQTRHQTPHSARAVSSSSSHRLPRPLSAFIGREQEIEAAKRWLLTNRLVTITGIGGVGKTRLAIQVAEATADEFPDGVWFVDLAPLADPILLPRAVAGALELAESAGTSSLQSLVTHLRERHLLLILDNCEHVVQASAELASALLEQCPLLHLLATSRQRLGLSGEVERRLPPMELPDLSRLAEEKNRASLLMEYEAVRLFVARARLAQPELKSDDRTLASIAQICCHLDGIPLALELAAARMGALGVEQIAARLNERFRLLVGGNRAAQPRQQTLRSLLDWSYDLLSEGERILLRRLSVFAGGWTLEAAETVCSDPEEGAEAAGEAELDAWEVLERLTGLVEKSLVVAEPQNEGSLRYRLLETVRQYGRERLKERGQEEESLCRRHMACFARFAEEAEPYLSGSKEQAHWFERLDRERANILAALDWCRSQPDSVEDGLRLGAALRWYWDARGLSQNAGQHLMTLLSMERENKRTGMHARALFVAAWLLDTSSEASPAERAIAFLPRLEEALAIYQELDDRQGIAYMWQEIGYQYLTQQDHDMARRYLEQSLTLWREIGDRKASAATLMGLGMVAERENNLTLARRYYEEAAAIDRDYLQRGGWALPNLARVLIPLGQFAEAEALAREDLGNAWELENLPKILFALETFMYLAEQQRQNARAVRLNAARQRAYQSIYQQNPMPWSRIERLRAEMKDVAFSAAWAEGYAMTLEQAIHYALDYEHIAS